MMMNILLTIKESRHLNLLRLVGMLILSAVILPDTINAQVKVSDRVPQYLFSAFADGIVVKKGGEKVGAMLNYNIVTEEMIFLDNEMFLALGGNASVDTVYLNNMVFIPAEKAYYELAFTGKIKLLVQFSGSARVDGKDVGYGGTSQTSRVTSYSAVGNGSAMYRMELPENLVIDRDITYFVELDGKMERFIGKRAFLNIFKNHKKDLETFIKENNTDFENYNDVLALIVYLDSIY